MFIASGPLYTERLILRAFRDSDLDDIARFEARPDVIRYLYWVAEDREGLRERLTRRLAMDRIQAAGDAMMLAVERQDSGAVIGHVMLSWASTEHMQGEIGFVFDPEQQGRGFATEAAQVVLQIGYERLGLHRIVGRADARNTRSIAPDDEPRDAPGGVVRAERVREGRVDRRGRLRPARRTVAGGTPRAGRRWSHHPVDC